MNQYFLLTYSVRAVTSAGIDIEKASYVRDEIADLDCWVKADQVETTFAGTLVTSGLSEDAKKKSAIKEIERQFIPILRKHEATKNDVQIYCVMMVTNIETPFEFIVER